jgi:hypothetical protein
VPFARDDHADPPARKALLWDRHGLAYGGSEIVKYLGLAPGRRFLISQGHEDVWFDESLLQRPSYLGNDPSNGLREGIERSSDHWTGGEMAHRENAELREFPRNRGREPGSRLLALRLRVSVALTVGCNISANLAN